MYTKADIIRAAPDKKPYLSGPDSAIKCTYNKYWNSRPTFVKNFHLHMQQTPYPLAHPPSAIPFNAAHSSFVQHTPLLPSISPVP